MLALKLPGLQLSYCVEALHAITCDQQHHRKTLYECMVDYKCFYITYITIIPQESPSPRYTTISRQADVLMHFFYNSPVSIQCGFSSLKLRDMKE